MRNPLRGQLLGVLVGALLGAVLPLGVEWAKARLFSPDIRLEFKAERPFIIRTSQGNDATREYYPVYLLRIGIRNYSGYARARGWTAVLTGLWRSQNRTYQEEKDFEPVRFSPPPYGLSDLSPGATIFAPLAKISHPEYQMRYEKLLTGDATKPLLRFAVTDLPRWMPSHLDPGRYEFRVSVFFDDLPPIQQIFELSWSGKWADDYDSMLREIKIAHAAAPK